MSRPAKEKNASRSEYGRFVRGVRDRLGLSRDAFAAQIGVTSKTLSQVELGYQGLGAAAKAAVTRVSEGKGVFDATGKPVAPISDVIAIMIDDANRLKANEIQRILGCSLAEAWQIVIGRGIKS